MHNTPQRGVEPTTIRRRLMSNVLRSSHDDYFMITAPNLYFLELESSKKTNLPSNSILFENLVNLRSSAMYPLRTFRSETGASSGDVDFAIELELNIEIINYTM
ncbi:jg4687 [Pararge aegeria aegeria]|uniref:Jg4687 protein n=1 Tax=Pararge aegeria aegeria TaxID=348720 RepID=A0A8S4RBR2_9NEOP|nr:jg4687 [Pararge aegeria aegeria]